MAIIRCIELNNEEKELKNVPIRSGQIIYCRDTSNVYSDTYDGHRHLSDFFIKVESLTDVINPDLKKLYLNKADNKLYRYDINEWIEVNTIIEIFDMIADQEDILSGYLTYNNRTFLPVTSSATVLRPDGSSMEQTLEENETEIKNILDPYRRKIHPDDDTKTTYPLPLPYQSYLVEGNTFSLYKNGALLTEGIDYTVDKTNGTVTFTDPITKNTDIDTVFHYINNSLDVKQEYWIAEKDQIEFELKTCRYLVGKNMTSLFINGIKQPKQSYTELSPTRFKLNNTVPKGTIVLLEVGKLVVNFDTFYSYFANKTEVYNEEAKTKTITVNLEDGHKNVITQTFDDKGRVITEVATIDGITISTQRINYSNNITTYITI